MQIRAEIGRSPWVFPLLSLCSSMYMCVYTHTEKRREYRVAISEARKKLRGRPPRVINIQSGQFGHDPNRRAGGNI